MNYNINPDYIEIYHMINLVLDSGIITDEIELFRMMKLKSSIEINDIIVINMELKACEKIFNRIK